MQCLTTHRPSSRVELLIANNQMFPTLTGKRTVYLQERSRSHTTVCTCTIRLFIEANNIDRMMIRTGYSLEHLDSPDVVIQNTTECLQPTTGTVYILQNTVVHNKQLALTGRSGIVALRIGCGSLHHMNRFLLDSIMDLEVVQIGNNVFQSPTTSNSTISITNCPKLVSIEIGSMSFLSLGSISITHCPLLSSLAIGSQSFPEYNAFELTDLPSLQSIHIGSNSFSALPTFNLRSENSCMVSLWQNCHTSPPWQWTPIPFTIQTLSSFRVSTLDE